MVDDKRHHRRWFGDAIHTVRSSYHTIFWCGNSNTNNNNKKKKKNPTCFIIVAAVSSYYYRYHHHSYQYFTGTTVITNNKKVSTAAYVFVLVIIIIIIYVLCCVVLRCVVLYCVRFLSSFHPLYYHTIIGLDGALYAWIGMSERGEDRWRPRRRCGSFIKLLNKNRKIMAQ